MGYQQRRHSTAGLGQGQSPGDAVFTEVEDPEENPYIFHPRAVGRDAFVTPRSLDAASDVLNTLGLDEDTVTSALIAPWGSSSDGHGSLHKAC